MKEILTSPLLLMALGSGSAQKIRHAQVREQDSGRKPVPGAQVLFTDAVPATSDQAGRFRLAFQNKKAGDLVFLTEIQKAGYELVNNEGVEQLPRNVQVLRWGRSGLPGIMQMPVPDGRRRGTQSRPGTKHPVKRLPPLRHAIPEARTAPVQNQSPVQLLAPMLPNPEEKHPDKYDPLGMVYPSISYIRFPPRGYGPGAEVPGGG